MKIETAQVRLGNAAYRYLRGLDANVIWNIKFWNILRGIWLDNGAEAVNQFVKDNLLNIGIGTIFDDCVNSIPTVRTNFTNADFEGTARG